MKISRFEDLEIWQEARELYRRVFQITSEKPFVSDFRFRDQMRASAGSVADNIAEGFDRGGNKEFIQFLTVSKGSCGEVRSQSYRANDSHYITQEVLDEFLERTDSITRKTINLINYLKNSSQKGIRFS